MHKRLFTAFPVEIGPSLTAAIKRVRINAQQKGMEFNWVPEANFHVTLSFLGNTDAARLPELNQILRDVAASSPAIETSLRGMGAFPDERHMRVLWVGVRRSRALASLQDNLEQALAASGFLEPEGRDYVPHLTIGRLRKSRSGTDLVSPYVRTSFGDISIGSVTLYESLIHGSQPVYRPLSNFELTGASVEEEGLAE